MRLLRLGSLVLVTGLLGSIPSNSVSATAGSDDALAEGGVITIIVDSPPSIAANLDARLLLSDDGTDLTDDKCGPLEVAAESPLPTRQCTGLDDGSYFIAPTGHPDNTGFPLPRLCISTVDAEDETGDIRLDAQRRALTCTITVAPPGVVIDLQPDVPSQFDLTVYDIDILDANGVVVSDDCELDTRFSDSMPRRWCAPLADGSYSTRPIDVPDGVIAEARCARITRLGSGGSTGFFLPVEDHGPFYRCSGAVQPASLTIDVAPEGSQDPAPGWSETFSVQVTDPSGANVTEQCTTPVESTGSGALIVCRDLGPGVHTVSIDGLVDGALIGNDCETVEIVPEGALCEILLDADVLPVPTTVPPTSVPPTTTLVTVLPETGTPSSNTTLIAAMTVAAGLGLLLISRRRSYS